MGPSPFPASRWHTAVWYLSMKWPLSPENDAAFALTKMPSNWPFYPSTQMQRSLFHPQNKQEDRSDIFDHRASLVFWKNKHRFDVISVTWSGQFSIFMFWRWKKTREDLEREFRKKTRKQEEITSIQWVAV